jgi:hypothetical protein
VIAFNDPVAHEHVRHGFDLSPYLRLTDEPAGGAHRIGIVVTITARIAPDEIVDFL